MTLAWSHLQHAYGSASKQALLRPGALPGCDQRQPPRTCRRWRLGFTVWPSGPSSQRPQTIWPICSAARRVRTVLQASRHRTRSRPSRHSGLWAIWTGPLEASPADEPGSQREVGVVEFGAAFPADGQALELVEQGEGLLHDAAQENWFSLQRRMTMQRIPPGSRSYQLPRSK